MLSDDDVLTLTRWTVLVEDHYSRLRGLPPPVDLESAKDGRTGHDDANLPEVNDAR